MSWELRSGIPHEVKDVRASGQVTSLQVAGAKSSRPCDPRRGHMGVVTRAVVWH